MTKKSIYWTFFLFKTRKPITNLLLNLISGVSLGSLLGFLLNKNIVSLPYDATLTINVVIATITMIMTGYLLYTILYNTWNISRIKSPLRAVGHSINVILTYFTFITALNTQTIQLLFSTITNIISFWGTSTIIIWGVSRIIKEYVYSKIRHLDDIMIPYKEITTFGETINYINAQIPNDLKDLIQAQHFHMIDKGCDYRILTVTWMTTYKILGFEQTLEWHYWFSDTPAELVLLTYAQNVCSTLFDDYNHKGKQITYFEDYDSSIINKIYKKITNKKD